jgi:hypothetical protein
VVNVRNPDLPILDELEVELHALLDAHRRTAEGARSAEDATTGAVGAPPGKRAAAAGAAVGGRSGAERHAARRRRLPTRRVLRRAAVALVLICLVGTVALAARSGPGGGPAADTRPVELGAGRTGGETWRLSAYRHHRRLCVMLAVGGGVTSDCGPALGPHAVRATSLLSPARRYVAGLAGPRVAQVLVRVGGGRVVAPTHRDRASGRRWFVVALAAGPAAHGVPATVVPRDRAGRALGPAALDCSLGVVGSACERVAEQRALAGGG